MLVGIGSSVGVGTGAKEGLSDIHGIGVLIGLADPPDIAVLA